MAERYAHSAAPEWERICHPSRVATLEERQMEPLHLTIEGMTCQHCVRAVDGRLRKTPGIEVQQVAIGSADLRYDAAVVSVDAISELIADEGYAAFAS